MVHGVPSLSGLLQHRKILRDGFAFYHGFAIDDCACPMLPRWRRSPACTWPEIMSPSSIVTAIFIAVPSTITPLLPSSTYQIWNEVSIPVDRYEGRAPVHLKRPCQAFAKIPEHAGDSSKAGVLDTVLRLRVERSQCLGGLNLIWQLSQECRQRFQTIRCEQPVPLLK